MITYREAQLADLSGIRDINVHYILHTSLTFMHAPPPLETYITKWHDLKDRGLPYFVAVDQQEEGALEAKVIGYASLSPFRGHLVSYTPTAELSLFVHPEYHSKSIGSNLLKILVDLLNSGKLTHKVEEAYQEVIIGVDGTASTGPTSQVRNIIAVMAVDPEGKAGGEALRKWYAQRGFVEQGRLKSVGFKRGHW